MSAFIVNDNHINAIVRWASQNNVSYWYEDRRHEIDGREQEVAECLKAENTISVNYRYKEDKVPEIIVYDPRATTLRPIDVIKACHCLDYQSCEHDEWQSSEAFAVLRDIQDSAARQLPGYDAAAWEIREKVTA